MFGHPSVLSGLPTRFEVRAPRGHARILAGRGDVIPLLGRAVQPAIPARSLLARGKRGVGADGAGSTVPEASLQPAAALVKRPPVLVSPGTTLRDTARRMTGRRGQLGAGGAR